MTYPARQSRGSRPTGRGWWRPVAVLAGVVVGVAVFSWLHNLAGTDVASATANAHALLSVERTLGVNVEVSVNHWLVEYPVLMSAAVVVYRLYYLPIAVVLLWVVFRRADVYPRVLGTMAVMSALALLVFWLVPMSPPRFALTGTVDIVAEHDLFGSIGSRDLRNGQNHFSAMPSLHVGWAAVCAYAAWLAGRGNHPGLAALAWLFPVVMVGVVITTGNHYVLDVAGTVVLLTISIATATAWERSRGGRSRSPGTGLSE